MPIVISEEHEALGQTVRRWLDTHCAPSVPRALLEAEDEELQSAWKDFASQGWLGIHVPEEWGGQGYGLFELAVILEETGRSLFPGPLLPTVVVSTAVAEAGNGAQARSLLPALVDGSVAAAVYLGSSHLDIVRRGDDGAIDVTGLLRPVLGVATASVVLVPARDGDDSVIWCLMDVGRSADRLQVQALVSLDPTRRVGSLEAEAVTVGVERQFPSLSMARLRQVALCLAAAEHAGGARWCLETASEYAKVRVQFGRPIGQFQAVKHRLANMLVTVEQITAVAWDAVLTVAAGESVEAELAAATAGAIVFDGYADNAKDCVQLLGGIGFTWEHDVHLHLKRAVAARQLFGESDVFRHEVAGLARGGPRRSLATALPDGAEQVRAELTPIIEELKSLDGDDRRRRMVDAGLVCP